MGNHPDNALESAFQRIWGEAPSVEERRKLLELKDTFGIDNNDSIWIIIMAFRYHLSLYEGIPAQIDATIKDSIEGAKAAAEAAAKETAEATKKELTRAVSTTASEIARATAQREKWTAIKWATIVAAVVVVGVGGYGYFKGQQTGYAEGHAKGYESAQDEKARASWANTPQGKRAYRLGKLGSIEKLAGCDGPGWYVRDDGFCFAGQASDGKIYGWRVKASE